jgi:ketosteroid isomerase-like protein
MDTNVEIYQRILETFNREGSTASCPSSRTMSRSTTDLPPGTYRGPEAVRKVTEQLMSGFEDVEIQDFKLVSAGDRVVALLRTTGKGEGTEMKLELHDAHTVTFRDGKVSYWRLYLDQAEALSDIGLDPSLASPAGRRATDASFLLGFRHEDTRLGSAAAPGGAPERRPRLLIATVAAGDGGGAGRRASAQHRSGPGSYIQRARVRLARTSPRAAATSRSR